MVRISARAGSGSSSLCGPWCGRYRAQRTARRCVWRHPPVSLALAPSSRCGVPSHSSRRFSSGVNLRSRLCWALNRKPAGAGRRVDEAIAWLRINEFDHEANEVARGAELAVLAGGGDFAKQVFEGIAHDVLRGQPLRPARTTDRLGRWHRSAPGPYWGRAGNTHRPFGCRRRPAPCRCCSAGRADVSSSRSHGNTTSIKCLTSVFSWRM